MKIAILGAGAFGTALGGILADKGHNIEYYDSIIKTMPLHDVLFKAKMMILCVPSRAVPHILPYLPHDLPMIIATKGLLSDTLFEDFKDYMVLSGPGFADDIKARKHTFLTATDERIIELFETDYLKFDKTDDKRGVLMCGALKNVYAIQAGLLGLKRESKEWNNFINEVVDEMKSILIKNEAKADTVGLVCGIGDLRLTCDYPSRNYEYGDLLRTKGKYDSNKTVEGLSTLARIRHREILVPENAIVLRQLLEESAKWS